MCNQACSLLSCNPGQLQKALLTALQGAAAAALAARLASKQAASSNCSSSGRRQKARTASIAQLATDEAVADVLSMAGDGLVGDASEVEPDDVFIPHRDLQHADVDVRAAQGGLAAYAGQAAEAVLVPERRELAELVTQHQSRQVIKSNTADDQVGGLWGDDEDDQEDDDVYAWIGLLQEPQQQQHTRCQPCVALPPPPPVLGSQLPEFSLPAPMMVSQPELAATAAGGWIKARRAPTHCTPRNHSSRVSRLPVAAVLQASSDRWHQQQEQTHIYTPAEPHQQKHQQLLPPLTPYDPQQRLGQMHSSDAAAAADLF
jgi:hypothetical protein